MMVFVIQRSTTYTRVCAAGVASAADQRLHAFLGGPGTRHDLVGLGLLQGGEFIDVDAVVLDGEKAQFVAGVLAVPASDQ